MVFSGLSIDRSILVVLLFLICAYFFSGNTLLLKLSFVLLVRLSRDHCPIAYGDS